MKSNEEVKEELQRQIKIHSLTKCYSKPTVQDAQKIIDLLDGDLKVDMGSQTETGSYYINLLLMEKLLNDAK